MSEAPITPRAPDPVKPSGGYSGAAQKQDGGARPTATTSAGDAGMSMRTMMPQAQPVVPPVTEPVEEALSGPNDTWHDVMPMSLRGGAVSGLDVLADPSRPGTFYAFLSNTNGRSSLGVFKSLDWGASWARVSTDGSLEHGLPWGEAIAPDGSYMLASVGYPDNGNHGAWKSTDGGATWRSYDMSQDNDPYSFDIDATNAKHVVASMHAKDTIFESFDGGETWQDRGPSGTGLSNYVFFISSTTWLSIPQDGGSVQTRRTTNSGQSWQDVCPAKHAHGNAQLYIDPKTGAIFIGGHGGPGVYRSTDAGASFSKVSDQRASSIWATDRYIYAMDPGANTSGTPPLPQRAPRDKSDSWSPMEHPSDMNNGLKRAAVAYDKTSKRWVIVGGAWAAGLWRYIESP